MGTPLAGQVAGFGHVKLASDMTKLAYQLEYDPAAWEGKAETIRHWMRRRVDQGLDNFKKVVEAIA